MRKRRDILVNRHRGLRPEDKTARYERLRYAEVVDNGFDESDEEEYGYWEDDLSALELRLAACIGGASFVPAEPVEVETRLCTLRSKRLAAEIDQGLAYVPNTPVSDEDLQVLIRHFPVPQRDRALRFAHLWRRRPTDFAATGEVCASLELARHLFVDYAVPPVFDALWTDRSPAPEPSLAAAQLTACYVAWGGGASLRHCGIVPAPLATRKAAAWITTAPAEITVWFLAPWLALRRAGASARVATQLLALTNPRFAGVHAPATSMVVRAPSGDLIGWLVNHEARLTDRELETAAAWGLARATTEFGFRMFGRSKDRVLAVAAEYRTAAEQLFALRVHFRRFQSLLDTELVQWLARLSARLPYDSLIRVARAAENMRIREPRFDLTSLALDEWMPADSRSWAPRGWNRQVLSEGDTYEFVELCSAASLEVEGEAMGHCVGGYWRRCMDDGAAIFSVRRHGRPVLTLMVGASDHVAQTKGVHNRDPKLAEMRAIRDWLSAVRPD